jgi:hypothetical protein
MVFASEQNDYERFKVFVVGWANMLVCASRWSSDLDVDRPRSLVAAAAEVTVAKLVAPGATDAAEIHSAMRNCTVSSA